MKEKEIRNIVPEDTVISKIYLIRGQKLMYDSVLAIFYGMEAGRLTKRYNTRLIEVLKILMPSGDKSKP